MIRALLRLHLLCLLFILHGLNRIFFEKREITDFNFLMTEPRDREDTQAAIDRMNDLYEVEE